MDALRRSVKGDKGGGRDARHASAAARQRKARQRAKKKAAKQQAPEDARAEAVALETYRKKRKFGVTPSRAAAGSSAAATRS